MVRMRFGSCPDGAHTRVRRAVLAALEEPEKLKNAFVPVYDQVAAPGDLIETFTERTGVKARRVPVKEECLPPEVAELCVMSPVIGRCRAFPCFAC